MDINEAIYGFWSSFNIPAYEVNSVPDEKDVTLPYITYEVASSSFDSGLLATASVWTRSTSWLTADSIAEEIFEYLGGRSGGGVLIPYEGGAVWITPENNFAQNMGDPSDNLIKRKVLSVAYNFI